MKRPIWNVLANTSRLKRSRCAKPPVSAWLATSRAAAPATGAPASAQTVGCSHAHTIITATVTACVPSSTAESRPRRSSRPCASSRVELRPRSGSVRPVTGISHASAGAP